MDVESWTIKKAEHWRVDAFELWYWRRFLRVPWRSRIKEIEPVNHKGNQSWIFAGRTDAEPEAPILWPPDVKSQLIGKDPDAGKDWGQEEEGITEHEMVGWHHRLSKHGFEQTPGDSEGQGSLAGCRGQRESEMPGRLNDSEGHLGSWFLPPLLNLLLAMTMTTATAADTCWVGSSRPASPLLHIVTAQRKSEPEDSGRERIIQNTRPPKK